MKRSCGTCRYGNNCPYGGTDLFCLRGYSFNSVMELCALFDNSEIRDELFNGRKQDIDFLCDNYAPIDHSRYFTYNDFGY
jgi:hypothetical protein